MYSSLKEETDYETIRLLHHRKKRHKVVWHSRSVSKNELINNDIPDSNIRNAVLQKGIG